MFSQGQIALKTLIIFLGLKKVNYLVAAVFSVFGMRDIGITLIWILNVSRKL